MVGLYGTIATVFGVLLFLRIAAWIFLAGAELSAILARGALLGRTERNLRGIPLATNGTLVRTTRSSYRKSRLMNSAFWLCSGSCHQFGHDDLRHDDVHDVSGRVEKRRTSSSIGLVRSRNGASTMSSGISSRASNQASSRRVGLLGIQRRSRSPASSVASSDRA